MTVTTLATNSNSVTVPDAAAALADIAAALAARQVVPYLGPGAFDLLPPDQCPIPRNSAELVQRLNAKVAAPGRIRASLTAVAQFIETRKHRKTLETILNEIFRQTVPATPVHALLAAIPAPPLLVDVWYDNVLDNLLSATIDRTWGQIQGCRTRNRPANGCATTPPTAPKPPPRRRPAGTPCSTSRRGR